MARTRPVGLTISVPVQTVTEYRQIDRPARTSVAIGTVGALRGFSRPHRGIVCVSLQLEGNGQAIGAQWQVDGDPSPHKCVDIED